MLFEDVWIWLLESKKLAKMHKIREVISLF